MTTRWKGVLENAWRVAYPNGVLIASAYGALNQAFKEVALRVAKTALQTETKTLAAEALALRVENERLKDRVFSLVAFIVDVTRCHCPPLNHSPHCRRENLLYPVENDPKPHGTACSEEILRLAVAVSRNYEVAPGSIYKAYQEMSDTTKKLLEEIAE